VLIPGYSPPPIAKEVYIQKIQELLPGEKLSDSVIKLLKNNKHFSRRLTTSWTKQKAKEFVKEANLYLKTSTKLAVSKTDGYSFLEVISYMGQKGTIILRAYDGKQNYCAKIGILDIIKAESEVGKKVVGPCVMPIIKFIPLPEDRAAIITPLYGETVADWLVSLEIFAHEDEIIHILLSGISAIYSFASQGLAHCDIKLNNLMFEKGSKIILIDFGSTEKFDGIISSTTPGIRFDHYAPSIRYDINSLSIAIAHVMLKKREEFASKEHMFGLVAPLSGKYPVLLEMLGLMRIDEDIQSPAELLDIWKGMYEVAKKNKAFVSEAHFAPPQ
jgi:serine/threonine protein kinase